MKQVVKNIIIVACLLPLFAAAGCQSLELYEFGIGSKETVLIEEERRISCQQPTARPMARDRCGKILYGEEDE